MIDFKSIIKNLKEMNDYYEQHLSDIDRYLEEKGLLEDYHEFEKRHSEEKKRQDNKETAEKIEDQKKEEEKKAEEERIEEENAETEDKESEEDKAPEIAYLFGGAVSFALVSSSLQMVGERLHMTLACRDGSAAVAEYSTSDNSIIVEDGAGRNTILEKVQKRKLLRLLAQVPKMAPETCIPQNVCDYLRPVELAIRHENIVRNYPDWDMKDIGVLDYEDYIREHPGSSESDYYDYITDCAVKSFAEPTGKEKGRYMSVYAELSEDFADVQIQDGFFELGEMRQNQEKQIAENDKRRTEKKKQL